MARKRKGRALSGWLNFDKPEEMSSAQAVNRLRKIFGAQKAGHAGTLDPLASGILPIAFGEATKTVPFLMNAEKTYEFTLCFGATTTTDDREGEPVETSDMRPQTSDISAALPHFIGESEQVPPAYSALKIDGERAYRRARAGEDVTLAARRIFIEALELVARPDADHAHLRVKCGKGTYIRALGRDLAAFLGTKGHISALRRVQVGPFEEKHAIGLEKCLDLVHIAAQTEACPADYTALDQLLLPLTTALDDIPALPVDEKEAQHLKMGRSVLVTPKHLSAFGSQTEPVLALQKHAMQNDEPIALGRIQEGRFYPTRVFNLTP